MMKNFTLLFALLTLSIGYAQTNPIDFEPDGNGADWTFNVFENNDNPPLDIIDNPFNTGINVSSKVARFTARNGGQPFAGFITNNQGTFTLDATNSTVTIKVYKSVISDVGIKFETAEGASTGEIKVANTLVDEWEELTFDFSSKIGEPSSTDITGLVIFPDFQDRTSENIVLLDDIVFSEQTTTNPSGPNTVTIDASDTDNLAGFANVSDLPEDGGTYRFGQGWGVADLKTTTDVASNTVTLQPNFNNYADNPTDPYWVDQTTFEGNKIFEGNTFIQNDALVGDELTFIGEVVSNTLDAEYEAMAFIKVFVADFSSSKTILAPLDVGQFSLTYDDIEDSDAHVQYGFFVRGRNANPDDEAALGSIVITSATLGVNDLSLSEFKLYPNPATTEWNLKSVTAVINTITVVDILGKEIMKMDVDASEAKIPSSDLSMGLYLAKVNTDKGNAVIRLIKN